MARPRKTLPANGIDTLKALVEQRATDKEIAAAFSMSADTWRRIRREDPRVKEIVEAGKQAEERELVGQLHKQAMDGNTTAAIFLLKSRHGYRDIGPVEGDDGPRVNLVFNGGGR